MLAEADAFDILPSPVYAAAGLRAARAHEAYEVVCPNTVPDGLELGPFDRIIPSMWIPLLQVFENTRGEGDFMSYRRMRDSLELALAHLPMFTTLPVGGAVPSVRRGPGAWLCEEETAIDFQEYKAKMDRELIPGSFWFAAKVDAISTGEAPTFSAKINRFKCGSVALVVMLNHIVGDGSSLSTFMDLWGCLARKQPVDPSARDARHATDSVPEAPGFVRKLRAPPSEPIRQGNKAICRISVPTDKLKAYQAANQAGYFSTDDVLTAAIWRAKIRACPTITSTYALRAVDMRAMVTPPQPARAVGNFADGILFGPFDPSQILAMPLHETCRLLRRELAAFDKGCVSALQAYLHHMKRPEGQLDHMHHHWDHNCSNHSRFYTATDFHNSPALFSLVEFVLPGILIVLPSYLGESLGVVYLDSAQIDHLVHDPELKALGISVAKVPYSSLE